MSRSKPAPPTSAPWTEAHCREALRWLCGEFAALEGRHMPIAIQGRDIASEMGFRRAIVREIDIDAQASAVRRVRALAEGRLVRETVWQVRSGRRLVGEYATAESARNTAHGEAPWHVTRVTRIRRAP